MRLVTNNVGVVTNATYTITSSIASVDDERDICGDEVKVVATSTSISGAEILGMAFMTIVTQFLAFLFI